MSLVAQSPMLQAKSPVAAAVPPQMHRGASAVPVPRRWAARLYNVLRHFTLDDARAGQLLGEILQAVLCGPIPSEEAQLCRLLWRRVAQGCLDEPRTTGVAAGAPDRAIRELPVEERLAFLLCDGAEKSPQEAAVILGWAVDEVRAACHRARVQLARALSAEPLPIG